MDISISDTVRKAVTKCKKGFSCLKKGKEDFCTVEDCINEQILFVKIPNNKYCPYRQQFGNEFICGCPARKEIYDKYRI